jgi:hypothetical protein
VKKHAAEIEEWERTIWQRAKGSQQVLREQRQRRARGLA